MESGSSNKTAKNDLIRGAQRGGETKY